MRISSIILFHIYRNYLQISGTVLCATEIGGGDHFRHGARSFCCCYVAGYVKLVAWGKAQSTATRDTEQELLKLGAWWITESRTILLIRSNSTSLHIEYFGNAASFFIHVQEFSWYISLIYRPPSNRSMILRYIYHAEVMPLPKFSGGQINANVMLLEYSLIFNASALTSFQKNDCGTFLPCQWPKHRGIIT